MRLYFIRHGQSFNNALKDQRDRVEDPELTDIGQEQAERCAAFLASSQEMPEGGFNIDELYVSPMKRTLQTAAPIAQALQVKPQVWLDIHEIGGIFLADGDGGVRGFGGLTRDQITVGFPDYALPESVKDVGWWDPNHGQETPAAFLARAIRVALTLRDRANEDIHIALVSHAAFLDALTKTLLNQAPTHPDDLFYLHYNTGISRFDFNHPYGRMRMTYFNRTAHLTPELETW